jgi:tripartite-type tricarboxylate transporter receptor subunit TctC
LASSRIAWTQTYPARQVRAIVPFAPGGLTDVFARLAAQKLSEHFGKQFYVENIAGGSGNIGTGQAARAAGGAGPAIASVIAGHTQIIFSAVASAAAQIKAGQLRPLAVTGKTRSAMLPDVPTTTEAGYPNVVVTVWNGFFVPAKTPKAIADKLGETILAVAAMPDVKQRLAQLGFEPTSIAGEQFQRDVVTELKTWAEIVEKAGIKAQ